MDVDFDTNWNLGMESKSSETHHTSDVKNRVFISSPRYSPGENARMLRNVVRISVAFTFLFTAYSSMSYLQSSLHQQHGLGNWSSAVVNASMVFSALFIPTAFIRRVTVKWAMFISMFGYTTFIAAQFNATFYTLIPAGIIVGICAAPLWTAKCTYLTYVGNHYAQMTGNKTEVIISRFFSIFFMFFQTHAVFGNLLSSTVLSSSSTVGQNSGGDSTHSQTLDLDMTLQLEPHLSFCGANFCPGTNVTSSTEIFNSKNVWTLAKIYLGMSLLAAIFLGCFVDSLGRYGETKRDESTWKLLMATFRQMKKPYQLLIIPLTIWSGMEQGFLSADFTAAYITCGWGLEKVGYVLICYGVADSISSICYEPLICYFGRVTVFIFAATINVVVIIVLLKWTPNSDEKIYYFLLAALWGVADSVWQCGINSYYGVPFPSDEEASFSNCRLWESLGFSFAFIESNLVCVDMKLYILLVVLATGMFCFLIIEILEWKKRTNSQS